MVSVTNKENPRHKRCQVMATGPASMGDLLQCMNNGDHWVTYPGCICVEKGEEMIDPDICMEAYQVWECSYTHIFPGVLYTPRDRIA